MRIVLWFCAGLLAIGLAVLAFCPAAWMAPLLEQASAGRLTLGDAEGTLWRGSAFVGAASGRSEPVTPLLPGRFTWRLSPTVLVGRVDLEVENPETLSQPVQITGTWSQWEASPASITLPAERLAALGAPLNTVRFSGRMKLSWGAVELTREGGRLQMNGPLTLEMDDLSSRLSSIKPLGAYRVTMLWRGESATMELKTVKGPLLLSGAGGLQNGHWSFDGRAEAETGHEAELANMLNLMGETRKEGDKTVIALHFK
jgi:general secretion pathway protein N